MFGALIDAISEILIGVNANLKKSFRDYNCLETATDNVTFVAKDGSLLSVLEIDGLQTIIDKNTYMNYVILPFAKRLSPNFQKEGHVIQSCFDYRPEKSTAIIESMLKPYYKQAKLLELDLEYVLDAQRELFERSAAQEKNYLLLWTTPAALSKFEFQEEVAAKVNEQKEMGFNVPSHTGNPFLAYGALINKHDAFVKYVRSLLSESQLMNRELTIEEAAREIRKGIADELTSDNWRPFFPGDRVQPQIVKQKLHYDEYDIMWGKLANQIADIEIEGINNKIVKVGNRYYSSVYIDIMPQEIDIFQKLFDSLLLSSSSKKGLNWRILYTMGGDGMAKMNLQYSISQILGFSSKDNKLFNGSMNYLKSYVQNGGTVVRFQISLCTWSDDIEELKKNISFLTQTVTGWGSCLVSDVSGNPIAGLASASMGFTTKGIATVSAAPIEEAVSMFPFSRPAQIWDVGSVLLQSPDGSKLLPFQPMSALQEYWVSVIFAEPGSGKSVFLNLTNLAFVLNPQSEDIPYISIIDIGFSSKGLIDLLQDALPDHKKNWVLYRKIQNTSEYCLNLFDTRLGCRFPLAKDVGFIVNMVATIMTDPSTGKPLEGILPLLNDLVMKLYERRSDCLEVRGAKPKEYTKKMNVKLDNVLMDLGYATITSDERALYEGIDESDFLEETGFNKENVRNTTWWDIVDFLVTCKNPKYKQSEYISYANIAQRYAMPTLDDLADLLDEPNIVATYGDLNAGSEKLLSAFKRMLAYAKETYPLLNGATRFDIANARIISLDLEDVASGDTTLEKIRASIMYMYALRILTKEFFVKEESLKEIPLPPSYTIESKDAYEFYKNYHTVKIKGMSNNFKRIVIDEYHKTASAPQVNEQIIVFAREARKYKVEIVLASQRLQDFNETLLSLQTSLFVMSRLNDETVKYLQAHVGIKEKGELYSLQNRIQKAIDSNGNVMVGIFKTKTGRFAQELRNKSGPIQLWAFSTTAEDYTLRKKLEEKVGFNSLRARKILAMGFPSGSARKEIEKQRLKMDANNPYDIYENICNYLLKYFGNVQ